VAVALIIGTIELVSVLADRLDITHGPLASIANINLDCAGFGIVVLFVMSWAVAISIWHFGNIEERWTTDLSNPA
jgi:nickel/cobalt transporter (NiCoT) family protein